MKRCIVVQTILFFLAGHGQELWCQESGQDSVPLYRLREVVISAIRTPLPIEESPVQVLLLDERAIRQTNGLTVADALQNAGGVFVRDYGGTSTVKTLSIRGSNSDQVLVLLNGQRVNSFQNGLADLSLLPLTSVQRIEVVEGGGSAFYGADAVGGVVNIMTRQPQSGFRARTEMSVGSFGYNRWGVEAEGSEVSLGLLGGYATETGRGDYRFHAGVQAPFLERMRENADFIRQQIYLNGSAALGAGSRLMWNGQAVHANRGVPGPFVGASNQGAARQNDDEGNVQVSYRFDAGRNVVYELHGGLHYNLETYVDPEYFLNSFYKNSHGSLNPQIRWIVDSRQTIMVGGEFAQALLKGNDFDSDITRVQKSVYLTSETHLEAERSFFDRFSFFGSLRYDHITDVDQAVTPKFGMNVRISPVYDVRVRASVGRNFRVPSFNDLYYRGFSNPLLKPEHSTSADAGIRFRLNSGGIHDIDGSLFLLDTEDRILFDPDTYLPVNIGKAESWGYVLRYDGSWLEDHMSVRCDFTHTEVRKKNQNGPDDPTYDKFLPYSPVNSLRLGLGTRIAGFTANISHSITGQRFTDAANASSLDRYASTDCNLSARTGVGSWHLLLKGEVNNLFDNDYEVYAQYPMPGRNLRLTVGIEY